MDKLFILTLFASWLALGSAFAPHTRPRDSSIRVLQSALVDEVVSCRTAKASLMEELKTGVADDSPTLKPYLDSLKTSYADSSIDARTSEQPFYNGVWTNVNTPAFPGRLGFRGKLPEYTIGTLTFGLLKSASDQKCSVVKMVQHVGFAMTPCPEESIPDFLKESVEAHPNRLRSNYIDTVFEMPDHGLKGTLRMEGYTFPSPDSPNKYDTWFLGGCCLPDDESKWRSAFGDDVLEYSLPNVMSAYQTVVYLDDDLRVSVGNRGSVMIVQRD